MIYAELVIERRKILLRLNVIIIKKKRKIIFFPSVVIHNGAKM